ncbi:MAG: pyridoxamine 5'-phosphate oxidase family protein [Methyloligellaceae bacterium]
MSKQDNFKNESDSSPWHSGERILQKVAGVADRMAATGQKVLRPYMPDQHRNFYMQLPFILAGIIDDANRPWATFLTGSPGFIKSPTSQLLSVKALPGTDDPAYASFRKGASAGLLGIELHTRRRNRANGVISDITPDGFYMSVQQTMGNCPKYIQLRNYEFAEAGKVSEPAEAELYEANDLHVKSIIEQSDTFFVATYADTTGGRTADVSHRGGKPGFVRVDSDGTLTIPDFSGNMFFNTLGNILVSRKAGLIFPDFESGDVLQLSGEADVISEGPEIAQFKGAERIWKVIPDIVFFRRKTLPFRWQFRELSPHLRKTGSWTASD